MEKFILKKDLSSKVLMVGNYYKNHHPGGISAVLQYWNEYIENMRHYPTFREGWFVAKRLCFLTSYIRLAMRMMFCRNARILHLHTAADGSFWRKAQIAKLGKFFCRKIVLHVHASRFKDFYSESSPKKQVWICDILRMADVLIVLSNSWKEWFVSIGVPADKIVVLHNITSFPCEMSSAKVDDGKIHYLFMGEIGPRKGIFDVLRGLANHREELVGKIELRIGGNHNESDLKKFIKDGNLEDLVVFEGWVGGEKKIRLLNWADVFILPSFNEGLPISILEAMSYSHPIISTPVGGIPEIVETGVNGVIVNPGDDDAIVAAMKKYIGNVELIKKEGAESLRRVSTYLPDYVMNHLKRLYESLIA